MGNVISDLASGAAGGILGGLGGLFKDVRSALGKVDPDKAAEIELKLVEAENSILLAQTQINLEEAKSEKWWKAGWRPFIGWICGVGLAVEFLILPIAALFDVAPKTPLDFGALMSLVIALLGLGAYRSYEKKSGVS
jgi:hypothetical protein